MKVCSICSKKKGLSEFPFQNKSQNKYMSACKQCKNDKARRFREHNPDKQRQKDRCAYQRQKENRVLYAREYRKNNKDKTRETNLKSKYGVTIQWYEEALKNQNYCCAICGEHQDNLKRVLCVDHCHTTGNVRQLLCDTCNKFLGFYEKLGVKCEEYLKKNK